MSGYRRLSGRPPVGTVRFGSLKRTTPITRTYGLERGQAIDRYYIEAFLRRQAATYPHAAIRGRVMEVGDDRYTRKFGDLAAIERIDVLDVVADNPRATLVADLADGGSLPSAAFDSVICAQTLLLIYDLPAAVGTLHRVLKPGGTLLLTVPGISQICQPEMAEHGDYWRLTTRSVQRLLEEHFDPTAITVESHGNVLAAAAFLYGLAVEDLPPGAVDVEDPDYQLVVAARAVKGQLDRKDRVGAG